MYYLAVSPAHRTQALGSRLMSDAEEWLRVKGAVKIQLMVRHSNEEAEVTVLSRWLDTQGENVIAD